MKRCEKCGVGKAIVHIAYTDNADVQANRELPMTNLCEDCAKNSIQSVTAKRRLFFCGDFRDGEEHERLSKRYKIVKLQPEFNRMTVRSLSETNTNSAKQYWDVRMDLIPRQMARAGEEVRINGTPLEIELFEGSVR
jgi:protein-arginine kinase activator protein McsA